MQQKTKEEKEELVQLYKQSGQLAHRRAMEYAARSEKAARLLKDHFFYLILKTLIFR